MVPLLLYALYPILWAGAVLHLVTRRGLGSCYPLYGSKLKVARGRGPLQGEEHGTGKCGKGGGYSRGPRVPQVRAFGSRTSLEAHGRDLLGAGGRLLPSAPPVGRHPHRRRAGQAPVRTGWRAFECSAFPPPRPPLRAGRWRLMRLESLLLAAEGGAGSACSHLASGSKDATCESGEGCV